MHAVIETAKLHPRDRFQNWRSEVCERLVPVEIKKVGESPFEGTLECAKVGSLVLTRITQGAVRSEITPGTIRRQDKHETLPVTLMLSGTLCCTQGGREAVLRPGEFMVLDRKPALLLNEEPIRVLTLEVPRERVEHLLGPVSLYAGLPVEREEASSPLFANFITDLVRIQDRLNPQSADRFASIGIDLLVAGLSERIARDAPKSLAGTLIFQRAKAYVEAHLGDPTLDATQLSIAMGVSLRRLQQLFQRQGQNISDVIWQRRLELAACRLSERTNAHLPLAMLAYSCGFISQSHFTRRFRDRFGMTPSDYRAKAIGS